MSSNLDWENYQRSVINCFENAFNDKSYNDVTLVSDDFENFAAHRVILTSCSPTFKKILQLGNHSHPMLYMRGFSSSQLSHLLKFIYKGQVQVPTEDINSFITKAQELQLLGNFENNEKTTEEKIMNVSNETSIQSSEKDVHKEDEKMLVSGDNEYLNEEMVMNEAAFQMQQLDQIVQASEKSGTQNLVEKEIDSKAEIQNLLTDLETVQKDINAQVRSDNENVQSKKVKLEPKPFPVDVKGDLKMIDTLMEEVYSSNGMHHCPQCEYKTNRKELLRTHLSSTHGGPKFVCTYASCAREYSSKANVRSHMKSYHNCDKCEETFEDNKDLKKHKKKEHPHPFLRL